MWIGILVLITFGICSIACLVLSIRGALQGRWHIFGALLIPAVGIGGTIIMLVARPVSLELFGDSNLEILPERAVAITGDDLLTVHNGTWRFGYAYDKDTQLFHWYDETYADDGGFSGRNDTGQTWSGGWDIVENGICLSRGQDTDCFGVWQDGDLWYQTNHRDEIVNRYMVMEAFQVPKGHPKLSQAVLQAIVPGRTLAGELHLHFGEPFYSASFEAGSDAVTVRRGDAAASLGTEEAGTYRIDDDGMLCLAGVLHVVDACYAVVPRPGGADIVRDDRRIVATVTELR